MAQGNKELSSKLAKSTGAMVPSGFEYNVKEWFRNNRKRLVSLAGGQEDRVALFIASAFAQVNRVPELMNCTPESFFNCLIFSMGTNLLPGPTQECYFIPYGKEATFIPSYQGLVKLAYNSGYVTRIGAHVVWEADQFEYDPANEQIYHRIFAGPEKERGKRIGAYVTIKNRFGEVQPTYKTAEFIEGIKKRSRGANSRYSPWNSEYASDVDAMWLKTVFKQAAKWIPKSANPVAAMHLGRAIEFDNAADIGQSLDTGILSDEVAEIRETIMSDTPQPQAPEQPSLGDKFLSEEGEQ